MTQVGMWTIAGLLVCFCVEKLCASTEESQHKVKRFPRRLCLSFLNSLLTSLFRSVL